ncbi:MAG: hypothetical protein D6719_05985 [Candidatus Dadabacteria bacterium]|nr:MAG: hypothetical protein D6719_05985 [Candidatus Dadabacteria bacterium]
MNDSKNTANQGNNDSEGFLDLPDAPDFISLPPEMTVEEIIKLCEEMLPVWNKKRFERIDLLPVWEEDFYL